jgi:hypothetical protein
VIIGISEWDFHKFAYNCEFVSREGTRNFCLQVDFAEMRVWLRKSGCPNKIIGHLYLQPTCSVGGEEGWLNKRDGKEHEEEDLVVVGEEGEYE